MKLPNAALATVAREKITKYLLVLEHRDNEGKAQFYFHFGFTMAQWQELADALLEHGRTHDVFETDPSPYGTIYNVIGSLRTPVGREPRVLTGWMVRTGEEVPRLTTAYPK